MNQPWFSPMAQDMSQYTFGTGAGAGAAGGMGSNPLAMLQLAGMFMPKRQQQQQGLINPQAVMGNRDQILQMLQQGGILGGLNMNGLKGLLQ